MRCPSVPILCWSVHCGTLRWCRAADEAGGAGEAISKMTGRDITQFVTSIWWRSNHVVSIVAIVLALWTGSGHCDVPDAAHMPDQTGTISGQVTDAESHAPLIGASVVIEGTPWGAAVDGQGRFAITGVPVGGYTIVFSSLSYRPLAKTDIIVRPGRISFVDVALHLQPIRLKGTQVRAAYFADPPAPATSSIGFTAEELRRTPGAAGDISRMIFGLPSVAKINDIINSLVVRGGNPIENAFYLDNIEIPNINHFPIPGSTGGPIGLLNVDFIEDVQFSAGGFPVEYGDRLSSVMDITFREGNREEIDVQLDANIAGFGFVAEGRWVRVGVRGWWRPAGAISTCWSKPWAAIWRRDSPTIRENSATTSIRRTMSVCSVCAAMTSSISAGTKPKRTAM